jgi:hypothetical protein
MAAPEVGSNAISVNQQGNDESSSGVHEESREQDALAADDVLLVS